MMRAAVAVVLALATVADAAPRILNRTVATTKATCPSQFPPGKHTITLDVTDPSGAQWARSFEVFVPEEMPLAEERPAIVNWHGCGSDPEKFEEESELDQRVGRFSFYSVYPRGTSRNLEPGTQPTCNSDDPGISCGWNAGLNPGGCQTPTGPAPDDVHFAEIVVLWMRNNLCVDMDRIFIVRTHTPQLTFRTLTDLAACFQSGFSNGGQMAYRLNCELSEIFAGVATNGMNAGVWTPGLPTCTPARSIPAINYCGSSDFVNCFGPDASILLLQTEAFAVANGCTGIPTRSTLSSTSFCFIAEGCPGDLPVQGCGIEGLPHCWPNFPGAVRDFTPFSLSMFTRLCSILPLN